MDKSKSDINGCHIRARAVYFSIGEEYLAPLLGRKGESQTDLSAVIKMQDKPSVVFCKEPRSWVDMMYHSAHAKCTLSHFFLSDG